MENLTLGTISSTLAFIVGLIGSVEYIRVRLAKGMYNQIGKIVTKEVQTVNNEMCNIKKEIQDIKEEVNINERDRIRYEILQFSGSLRNGLERTENDYRHIEEIFEKYEQKGWNSYVHSEMEFIRSCRNKIDK